MIESKTDYNRYLTADRESSDIFYKGTLKQRIKHLLFPKEEWVFIKALRWFGKAPHIGG